MKERLDAIWLIITRVFWLIVLGSIVVGFFALFTPKYAQYNELNRRVREMQESNRELASAIRRLESQQQRFVSDPSFVERTARELGMAKPGEIVYKYFSDDID